MESDAAAIPDYRDALYVSPTCYAQTAESRFGEDVLEDLKSFVFQIPHEADIWVPVLDAIDMMEEEEDEDADTDVDDGIADLYDPDLPVGSALETDPGHAEHGFPRIATTRNNLTALSQRYNLYFAAYQDRVYVYQPRRTAPHILPAQSLILHPRPSKLAEQVGGVIDKRFPHQINHIIVGNLGDIEIVLLAYDDGDVAAYYTHAVARSIKAHAGDDVRRSGGRPRPAAHLRPFFHENVGKSAWGLAIHERSRLIAVGSNLHEVTVFAFALTSTAVVYNYPDWDVSPRTRCGQTAVALERHLRSRTRTWRIVLPLSHAGSNIPNVTFMDDEHGEADRVVAIDVAGNVWLLDIWSLGTYPLRWPKAPLRERMMGGATGWGVLVLPDSSFRPAKTVYESLGVPGGEIIPGLRTQEGNRVSLDITCCLYYVKDLSPGAEEVFRPGTRTEYPRQHAAGLEVLQGDSSDAGESGSESEFEDAAEPAVAAMSGLQQPLMTPVISDLEYRQWTALSPYTQRAGLDLDDMSNDMQMGRSIVPLFGETGPFDGSIIDQSSLIRHSSERQRRTSHVEFLNADLPAHITRNLCLLRTSTTDIELQPFDRDAPCVECKCVLACHHDGRTPAPWDLHPAYSQRVSMLVHVPELSLVAAGSPTGRVALLTLTRTARTVYQTRLRRGFRVDCVLPRKADVERRLRPDCTLVGIAMSPVPSGRRGSAGGGGGGFELRPRGGAGERTAAPGLGSAVYRLILHYKDHRILMYDVARRGDELDLAVL